jgi:hypothetical protein
MHQKNHFSSRRGEPRHFYLFVYTVASRTTGATPSNFAGIRGHVSSYIHSAQVRTVWWGLVAPLIAIAKRLPYRIDYLL